MIKFDNTILGKQVRFINAKAHEEMPEFYPEVNTIGIVISVKGTDFEGFVDDFAVQWPEGSTASVVGDCWLAGEESLELLE